MTQERARRAQVVLPADEYALLETSAAELGTTVSALIRDVLERTLLASLHRRRQDAAMQRLFNQELPTAEWRTIERELEGRWLGHEPT